MPQVNDISWLSVSFFFLVSIFLVFLKLSVQSLKSLGSSFLILKFNLESVL